MLWRPLKGKAEEEVNMCLLVLNDQAEVFLINLLLHFVSASTQTCNHDARPAVWFDRIVSYTHVQIDERQSLHGNGHVQFSAVCLFDI